MSTHTCLCFYRKDKTISDLDEGERYIPYWRLAALFFGSGQNRLVFYWSQFLIAVSPTVLLLYLIGNQNVVTHVKFKDPE